MFPSSDDDKRNEPDSKSAHTLLNAAQSQGAKTDMFRDEDKDAFEETKMVKKFENTLANLFKFNRSARQKALSTEMKRLSTTDKKFLKQEYMLKEANTLKGRNEKMSINDFEVLKILGI